MQEKITLAALIWLSVSLNMLAQDYLALRSDTLKSLPDSLKSKNLTELSYLFGTDKLPYLHNFIEVYERYFSPVKYKVKKVFEIGVLSGASHKMWKCYFNNAEIYGIDIEPKPWLEKLGVHVYLADQGDRKQLQAFIEEYGSEFDIIIDDGSHYMSDQQISLGFLFKHLRRGGLYIIEDVHTSIPEYYPGFGKDADMGNTTLKMINDFVTTDKIESKYMLPEETIYLDQCIEYIELSKRTNGLHSTLCIIKKKE
jgi:hypothetical protein